MSAAHPSPPRRRPRPPPQPPGTGRADARRDRRRLRRHRHQPAVHRQGGLRAGHRRAARRGAPDRRGVVHLLGADAGGDAEVRDPDPARRQPRRRRRPGADGAGHARGRRRGRALRGALLLLGVFGATLFYGDSVITPAISVLGAMEGLEVATPALKAYVRAGVAWPSWSGCSWCSASAPRASARLFGPDHRAVVRRRWPSPA